MPPSRYRQLDDTQIVSTLGRIRHRIAQRFPDAGLVSVADELLALANEASACVAYLRRPNWPLRIAVGLTILIMVAIPLALATSLRVRSGVEGAAELVQGIEASINNLVFLGIAVFFLLSIETRIKRHRALSALHELRSVVHIVDMHQLTKDPERLSPMHDETPEAMVQSMSAEDLWWYLDYCSELLSLSSKVAALFVQHFDDAVVLGAVNEIESLATGFSSKIWQKITLLERGGAA